MDLASAALELSISRIGGMATTGVAMTGIGRVAVGVVIIVRSVVFYYFGGVSAGSTRTCLNCLIRSRVFMLQVTAPFWSS